MDRKYMIDTDENKKFLDDMREKILFFGSRFPSPGGSSYYLGDDGTPWTERPRETWITSRMAHVYSIGALLGHENSGNLADAAIKGLRGELHDKDHGGYYAGRNSDGSIMETKQCYAHAFVMLAASSALLAKRKGAEELLSDAIAIYDKYFWNEEEGLSCDTWNTEFTHLDSYRGLNANMHTVEAFLAVSDVTGDEKYRVRAGRIIRKVRVWAEGNNYRIPEHYSSTWVPDLDCNKDNPADPFKPYGATPGHGIEWSRLVLEWALSTFKKESKEFDDFITYAEKLFDRAISDAWNVDNKPGIAYTTDWNGKPVVKDRMHWTLAEAINTSAVLYHTTGKEKYSSLYHDFMKYLDEKVLDHVNGSWFHQLDEDNNVIGTVWPGKSDLYHAFQATLIPYLDASCSVAPALVRTR